MSEKDFKGEQERVERPPDRGGEDDEDETPEALHIQRKQRAAQDAYARSLKPEPPTPEPSTD